MYKHILDHYAYISRGFVTAWIVLGALFLMIATIRYKSFFEKGIHTKTKPFKKQAAPKRNRK